MLVELTLNVGFWEKLPFDISRANVGNVPNCVIDHAYQQPRCRPSSKMNKWPEL